MDKQTLPLEIHAAQTKICLLCGALNLGRNWECFVCGWCGAFDHTPRTVRQAWARLEAEVGVVRYDHLTGRQFRGLNALDEIARSVRHFSLYLLFSGARRRISAWRELWWREDTRAQVIRWLLT